MTTQPTHTLSRRTSLAALAGGSLALALGSRAAVAQAEPVDHTGHPLTGMWLAMPNPTLPEGPPFPAPSLFAADGTVLLSFPVCQRGANGVEFYSPVVGTWEPHDEQTGHFTAVQTISDIEGTFLSSV